ncbi:CHAT domain-containing protein [Methylobacterium sp. 174MFSha1.1]|nr:CHAT domain-containing protein [Methylobacterium sp. 174MFSha1.1]
MLPELDTSIIFLISVPDWKPEDATPFQGFAPSLCENAHLLEFIQQFPSDILELTPDQVPYRVLKRISGVNPIRWLGQSPRTLKSQMIPEFLAFTIVMLGPEESIDDYRYWIDACPAPLTVIASKGGHISYSELSFESLRDRLLNVCSILEDRGKVSGAAEARNAISSWVEMPELSLEYEIQGHGTIAPNVITLRAAGYAIWSVEPFRYTRDEKKYVEQIVRTTHTVLDIRDAEKPRQINRAFPQSIDLNLYCPATYDLRSFKGGKSELDIKTRKRILSAIRMIERQSSYNFSTSSKAQVEAIFGIDLLETKNKDNVQFNPLLIMRASEVRFGNEIVACLAASEISAVVRLPNRINRTKGIVRQFAQHYRAEKSQIQKRSELFRDVQRALSDAFPTEFYDLLQRSKNGVRIISDAHVEWLNIKGFPLGLRYNVARLPVTPGNAFVGTAAAVQTMFLEPDDLLDVLVIGGLANDDIVGKPFDLAFEQFGKQWRNKLRLTRVNVKTRNEFIDALNAFNGMIMVFDGHGSHRQDQPGVIWLNKEPIDVWRLRGDLKRVPPIVILSACDTHAADRNHATVANGFLALGSRSVLGSVFPLNASHAAIFTARLLYRVTDYIPAALKMLGRSLTWLEIVSGMLRRQLTTDILRHLENTKVIPMNMDSHYQVSRIVDTPRDDVFSDIREYLIGISTQPNRLDNEIYKAIANSDIISYLHLGRPETVVIQYRTEAEKYINNIDRQNSSDQ